MSRPQISIDEARQIDIVEYLETLGYQPQKIRNNDYWYLCPLRDEKTTSFKVDRKLNAWYDHGIGKGGNMIDFRILYHHCSIPELLQKLFPFFSFHQETLTVQQPRQKTQSLQEALEPKIKVIAAHAGKPNPLPLSDCQKNFYRYSKEVLQKSGF
jgi:DNA primase